MNNINLNSVVFKYGPILFLLSLLSYQSPAQREVHRFSNEFCNKMRQKYHVSCSGYGSKMKYNIIDIPFTSFDRLSIDEARILYVNIMEQLLNDINHDVDIRPYLQSYPFTIEGPRLRINFQDRLTRDSIEKPFVESMSLSNGKINYMGLEKQKYDHFISLHKESYSEAYEKVYGRPWVNSTQDLPKNSRTDS